MFLLFSVEPPYKKRFNQGTISLFYRDDVNKSDHLYLSTLMVPKNPKWHIPLVAFHSSPQNVKRMAPRIAPIPETIIPETNKIDCEKSPWIMVPSTRLPKLNFAASRINLPRLKKKNRSLSFFTRFLRLVFIL